jgi:hypothetical protein
MFFILFVKNSSGMELREVFEGKTALRVSAGTVWGLSLTAVIHLCKVKLAWLLQGKSLDTFLSSSGSDPYSA